jgi:hypothetical protein
MLALFQESRAAHSMDCAVYAAAHQGAIRRIDDGIHRLFRQVARLDDDSSETLF